MLFDVKQEHLQINIENVGESNSNASPSVLTQKMNELV